MQIQEITVSSLRRKQNFRIFDAINFLASTEFDWFSNGSKENSIEKRENRRRCFWKCHFKAENFPTLRCNVETENSSKIIDETMKKTRNSLLRRKFVCHQFSHEMKCLIYRLVKRSGKNSDRHGIAASEKAFLISPVTRMPYDVCHLERYNDRFEYVLVDDARWSDRRDCRFNRASSVSFRLARISCAVVIFFSSLLLPFHFTYLYVSIIFILLHWGKWKEFNSFIVASLQNQKLVKFDSIFLIRVSKKSVEE